VRGEEQCPRERRWRRVEEDLSFLVQREGRIERQRSSSERSASRCFFFRAFYSLKEVFTSGGMVVEMGEIVLLRTPEFLQRLDVRPLH
jgi:hypothetical protein